METVRNAILGCCGGRKRASEIAKNGLLQLVRKVNLEPCAITKRTHTTVSLSHPLTRHPFVRLARLFLWSSWKFARSASASQWLLRPHSKTYPGSSRSEVRVNSDLAFSVAGK